MSNPLSDEERADLALRADMSIQRSRELEEVGASVSLSDKSVVVLGEQLRSLLHKNDALSRERNELRAVVEKLPKTADGVRVVPGVDVVYWPRVTDKPLNVGCGGGAVAWTFHEDDGTILEHERQVRVDECYSTSEAALAAAGSPVGSPPERPTPELTVPERRPKISDERRARLVVAPPRKPRQASEPL